MEIQPILEKLQISEINQMQKTVLKAADKHKNIILLSPTGSGKTLGFILPILKNLDPSQAGVQALILVPARELALQIEQVFRKMATPFKISVCYGGHDKKTELNNFIEPPTVLVGTPGRIAYHLRNQNFDPTTIHSLVLDEFDKSLELGFQDDMALIVNALSEVKFKTLTSATPMDVIPDFVAIAQPYSINFLNSKEEKPNIVLRKVLCTPEEKLEILFQLLCKIGNKRTLIFCNHRDAVDRISALLREKGIARETFHGGMEQDERERAIFKFKNDSSRILITTDLAARGLDIPEVESIVHYQLPPKEDAFVHRNGRTARMKAHGFVYLIMTEDEKFPFINNDIEVETLQANCKPPARTPNQTLYISAGKKDKVNKVDIVGFLIKKGNLQKEDIGLIEVKDKISYVAINRLKTVALLKDLEGEKLKNKKLKIEFAY